MKSKIIKRFAGVLAFLMLATQISLPVYAVTDDTADNSSAYLETEGVEGESTDASHGESTDASHGEDVALSSQVDEANVVEVLSSDVEEVNEASGNRLVDQAVEEVVQNLEGESADEITDALEDLQEDIKQKINDLLEEIEKNPELKERLTQKIRHLKDLLARLRAKLIHRHQNLVQSMVKTKNVPAVYEIRWGDLTGQRQPCRLLPLSELKEALDAGEMPAECEPSKVDYNGEISIDLGDFEVKKEVLFEENDEVVTASGKTIEFNSVIAGHWDGLVVEYNPPTTADTNETPKVTVSIGDLDETYVGNEVLGRKRIGNNHFIEFRHLGRILPGMAKAAENHLIQTKLKIQEKVDDLRSKLDRIRLMKNAGAGADELEEAVDEAGEYNFDDTTATEVENEIQAVVSELDDDTSPAEIKAKAERLRNRLEAAKNKAKLRKFRQNLIPFKDTDDNQWYTDYVSAVKNRGIISGYKDAAGNELGEFRPANNITVAEILKIALETADKGKASGTPGLRAALNHWAKGYAKKAEELGLDLVESDVDLNRPATRAEVVRLMLEAFGIEPDTVTSTDFSDVPRTHKHAKFIEYAKSLGIVSGDDNATTFRPDASINRAEAAKIADLINEIIMGGSDMQ